MSAVLDAITEWVSTHPRLTGGTLAGVALLGIGVNSLKAPIVDLPGPKAIPFFGTMLPMASNLHRLHDWVVEMAELHGAELGLFRSTAPGRPVEIFLTDPDLVQFVLSALGKSDILITQSDYAKETLSAAFGEKSIFMVDGQEWRFRRKHYSFLFSNASLRDLMFPKFHTSLNNIKKKIDSHIEQNDKFDIQGLFQRATLDALGKIALDKDFGCFDERESPRFMNSLNVTQETTFLRYFDPIWKVKRYFNVGSEATFTKSRNYVNKVIYEYLDEREASKKLQQGNKNHGPKNIVDMFEDKLIASGDDPTREVLRDLVWDMIIAGNDTTSASTTWLLYHLLSNPRCVEKVREEMSQVDWKDYRSLKNEMPYLQACIFESLRLKPSVASDMVGAAKDFTLPNGVAIKKGWGLFFHPYSICHNKNIWGEDAYEYKPERWIDNSGEYPIVKSVSIGKYPVFNGGPRACLGKEMSSVQTKIYITNLLDTYDLELVSNNVEYGIAIICWVKGGLWIRARHRIVA